MLFNNNSTKKISPYLPPFAFLPSSFFTFFFQFPSHEIFLSLALKGGEKLRNTVSLEMSIQIFGTRHKNSSFTSSIEVPYITWKWWKMSVTTTAINDILNRIFQSLNQIVLSHYFAILYFLCGIFYFIFLVCVWQDLGVYFFLWL